MSASGARVVAAHSPDAAEEHSAGLRDQRQQVAAPATLHDERPDVGGGDDHVLPPGWPEGGVRREHRRAEARAVDHHVGGTDGLAGRGGEVVDDAEGDPPAEFGHSPDQPREVDRHVGEGQLGPESAQVALGQLLRRARLEAGHAGSQA